MGEGYDLSRKMVYISIAAIVLAVIFLYTSNAVQNNKVDTVKGYSLLEDYISYEGLKNCFVGHGVLEQELIPDCLGDDAIVKIDDTRYGDGDAKRWFSTLVLLDGKLKMIGVGVKGEQKGTD